ncbi:MAG: IclR family transcriptional regulator [Hyphomicrobiales bacterium]|nr:MAG: IclR family transcriptional regulator [Hyphomicrobiales bacterium]
MDETIKDNAEKSPVHKALRLLSHIAQSREPVTLADLSRALRLPKPTTYRLAQALEYAGFLQKDPLNKRYLVGALFEEISLSAMRNGVSHSARRLMLNELAERIGARINLAVVKSGRLLLVEWVESTSPLRIDLRPETHIPVHCSASGKLLVAFGPPRMQEVLLRAAPFEAKTKKTITTARAMTRELDEIRRRGHAEDNEEFLTGVNCLAVPIRNASGDVIAGLAAMAPTTSLPLPALRRRIPDLMACAERITAEIAATPTGVGRPKRVAPATQEEQASQKGRKTLEEDAA